MIRCLLKLKKTNDQLCYEQLVQVDITSTLILLGGGASCDCLDGYEWDLLSLHCLKKETENLLRKQISKLMN